MDKGELNEEILKKEAQNMYGDMENNPLFGNLMQKMNSNVDSENKSDTQDSDTETELTREEKKEILKKKIEEKKKERSK
jgi:hypothetical protein